MNTVKNTMNLNSNNIECYTPKYAVNIIVPFLEAMKNKKSKFVIWAPFSKDNHHFANYLRKLGFEVINTHIDNGQDFITYEPNFEFDMILDNPPFKNKTKFVEKAISYKKPFALFLPFNSLGDRGIPNLFLNNNLDLEMLIPDHRTEFHNQITKGISFKTIYLCNGVLPRQLILTKMKKEKISFDLEME